MEDVGSLQDRETQIQQFAILKVFLFVSSPI